MGVAYHSHYLVWFELGRTELMRNLGCPYAELEDRDGIAFPVIEAGVKYLASARYDDRLTVRASVTSMAGARIRFEYELVRAEDDRLLATGFTRHASVGRDGRPRRLPADLRNRLEPLENGK